MDAATKGTRMNIKALAAVAFLWAPMAAVAADDGITSKIDSLNQKLEKILSSQGISIGGQVTGAFGASILGGNGLQNSRRDDEGIGFTQVDFDLRARPSSLSWRSTTITIRPAGKPPAGRPWISSPRSQAATVSSGKQ